MTQWCSQLILLFRLCPTFPISCVFVSGMVQTSQKKINYAKKCNFYKHFKGLIISREGEGSDIVTRFQNVLMCYKFCLHFNFIFGFWFSTSHHLGVFFSCWFFFPNLSSSLSFPVFPRLLQFILTFHFYAHLLAELLEGDSPACQFSEVL